MFLVSVLHALFATWLAFYAFFFPRSKYDYFILFIIFTIAWCWTLHKGECFISYYVRKINDPSYKMGTEVNADDMYIIFGDQNKEYLQFFFSKICPFVQIVNIYLLMKRNSFSSTETILYPLLFFVYYYSSYLKSSLINTSFTIVFTYILYRIVKHARFI
jgi:hypothetical protein